jgi:hypothetical protein
MPGFLFHVGASASCPHGGRASVISTNNRVLVGGQPVATLADQYPVAGCPFTVPPSKPQPCVKVEWLQPATRVKVNGQPVILATSAGICQSAEQAPQGAPTGIATQTRVGGV